MNLHPINTNKLSLMSTVLKDYGIMSTCIFILVCIHVFGELRDQLSVIRVLIESLLIVYANEYSSSLVHPQCNG